MRWLILAIAGWLGAAGAALAVEPGQSAPAFELPGTQGALRLDDLRGKTVYLDFWASWCAPCKQSFPWMNELQQRHAAAGLRVVGVNVDKKPEAAQGFLAAVPARFDIVYDPAGTTPRAYAVKAMPTSVLIGPDGKVLLVHRGFSPGDRAELEQRITRALAASKP